LCRLSPLILHLAGSLPRRRVTKAPNDFQTPGATPKFFRPPTPGAKPFHEGSRSGTIPHTPSMGPARDRDGTPAPAPCRAAAAAVAVGRWCRSPPSPLSVPVGTGFGVGSRSKCDNLYYRNAPFVRDQRLSRGAPLPLSRIRRRSLHLVSVGPLLLGRAPSPMGRRGLGAGRRWRGLPVAVPQAEGREACR